jgi:hypothetical protein
VLHSRSQPPSNYQFGEGLKHRVQPEWQPSDQVFDHTSQFLEPKISKPNFTGISRELTKPAPSVHHILDESHPSSWTHPLVLRQPIPPQLTPSIDSPLLTISHQLHITLTLINKIDEITIKVPLIISSIPITNLPTTTTNTANPTTPHPTTTIIDAKDLRIRPPSEYSDDEISEKFMEDENKFSDDSLSSSEDEGDKIFVPAEHPGILSEQALSSTLRPPSSIVGTPTTLISAHTFGRPVRRFASALDLSVPTPDVYEEENFSRPSRPLLTIDVSLANGRLRNSRKQAASKLLSLRKSTSAEQLISFRSSETLPESDRNLFSKLLRTEQNEAYHMLQNQEMLPTTQRVGQSSQNNLEKQYTQQNDPPSPRKQHYRSISHPTSSSISFLQLDDDTQTVHSSSNSSDTAPSLSSTATASTGTARSNPLQSRPPTPVLSLVPALPGTTILHQPLQQYSLPEEDFPVPMTATTIQSTIASSGVASPFTSRLRSMIVTESSSSDGYDTLTMSSSGPESSKLPSTRASSSIIGREEMMKRYMRNSLHRGQRRQDGVIRVKTRRMTRLYDEDAQDEVLDPLPPVPQVPQYNFKNKTRSTITEYSSDYDSNSDENSESEPTFNFLDHDPHDRSGTPLPRLPRLSFGASFASVLGVIDDEE